MRKFSLLLLFFIGLCAWSGSRLCAQATGGTISGTLSDSTGAPRPNATITLENVTTGQRITATTDNNGFYRIEGAPAGRYRVVSTATATSGTPAQEITIAAGSPATVNLTVATGPATDTFMTAETVPTRLSPATLQNTYNTQMVQYLPQPNFVGRDGSAYGAYNLSLQVEGVNPSTFNVGSNANAGPSVIGERPTSNNYHIDGIDNNNKVNPGPLVYVSNEATSEFSLFHNQPSPNFGHSSGGNFNSTIRNGSNGVHGQIYDYLQNRNLNARDQRFTNLGINGDQPGYDQNRLGGSIGLPILPSKLFFFGNFEYIPLRSTEPFAGTAFAPTAAGFQSLRGVSGVSATNLGILQNAIGTSVGPAAGTTTINGVSVPVGQIQSTFPLRMEQYMGTGAVDFTPREKDRVSLRYVHNEMNTNDAFPGGLPAFATSMRSKSLLASGSYYHTFFNAVTNELRLGFNRYTNYTPLNNTSGLAFSSNTVFPDIQIGGASNFALGQQFGTSLGAAFNTYHLADGLSMRAHGHELRFGFDGRRYLGRYDNYTSNFGNYGYSSLSRFLADLPPDVTATRSFFNTGFSPNTFLLNGYFQDTYNFAHSVSVDAGIRYEYSTIPAGIASQRFNTSGITGLLGIGEPRSSTNNWGPYLGFAVSPFHNYTVLRAGAGVFFDTLYGYQNIGMFAPGLGAIGYGNTSSNTAGFLAGGGVQNPVPNSSIVTPAQARASTTSWFGNQRTPYSLQWNAAWQQAIWRNFTVEFKYMGVRGYHQPFWQMLNAPGTVSATNSLPLFYNTPTQAQLNALPLTLNQVNGAPSMNPLLAAGFTNPVMTIAPDANSWYHGATVSLDHHFTGGFQFKGNYTWSHLIDDATGTPLDLVSTARVRGNSLFDRRHTATATALWDVGGAFRNSYSIVRNVFADFTLGGTYTFASGGTVPIAGNGFGIGGFGISSAIINSNGIAGTGSGVTALRNSSGNIVAYQAMNPNAQFIAGAPGLFAVPNRAGFTLDDINTFDVSAVKRFNFAERASIEFRGDAYNLLNKSQFTGTSATAIGSRYLMNLPGFLNPSSAGFGNFGTVFPSNARMLQVAARLTF